MDKSVAQITTVYDQELAECCNMMRAMIGNEEGRELLKLAQNVITAMQEREGKEIEAVTTQTVGVFARLGYLAAMNSLGEYFSNQPKGADGGEC
jgi:hypothetical protein